VIAEIAARLPSPQAKSYAFCRPVVALDGRITSSLTAMRSRTFSYTYGVGAAAPHLPS
jgi:hypothetical protein